jgi:uncharacterized membrane protein (DUF373 family)
LEAGDSLAHVIVSVLLLLLAAGILIASVWGFGLWLTHSFELEQFADKALDFLSGLLFGVIVLELLSTILTYIKARNLEATIKDFLIVALISSIRKILLIGAHSSRNGNADDFLKESFGTAISIISIVVLIGGLLLLDWRVRKAREVGLPEPGTRD